MTWIGRDPSGPTLAGAAEVGGFAEGFERWHEETGHGGSQRRYKTRRNLGALNPRGLQRLGILRAVMVALSLAIYSLSRSREISIVYFM